MRMVRTGRRTNQEILRDDMMTQLRETLDLCQKNMFDEELTLLERQRWAQVHTNAAQVLNTILRDEQFHEWEKKLKLLEKQGLIDQTGSASPEP